MRVLTNTYLHKYAHTHTVNLMLISCSILGFRTSKVNHKRLYYHFWSVYIGMLTVLLWVAIPSWRVFRPLSMYLISHLYSVATYMFKQSSKPKPRSKFNHNLSQNHPSKPYYLIKKRPSARRTGTRWVYYNNIFYHRLPYLLLKII